MGRWAIMPLGDVATVSAGNAAPQDKALFRDGRHPFIRTSDVGRIRFGLIESTADYLNDAGIAKLRRFPRGTILFPKSGASTFLNHRAMMDVDGYVASHLATIQTDSRRALGRYLLYFLSTVEAQDLVQDHDYPSLNLPLIRSIEVPMPSIAEQERIVAILDEAFVAIATATVNAEKNLANARELFQGILDARTSDVAGRWRMRELQQDIRFIDYRGRTPRKTEEGMRLITAKNVKMGVVQDEPREYVGPEIYDEWMTRGVPINGDVLFTTEAPLGNVAQLDTGERVVFAQRIITLQPDRDVIDPALLSYVLRSSTVQRRIHENATGATATGIKASLLKRIHISLPESINVQGRIAVGLAEAEEECKRLAAYQEKKLTLLAELKQSILHKAFTGGLTADAKVVDRALSEAGV